MAPTGFRLPTLLPAALSLIALLLTPAPGTAQIQIPGLRQGDIIEAWVDGPHVILKTEDDRLFSIPLGTPGIEQTLEGLSSTPARLPAVVSVQDIIDMLRAGISEATIKAHIRASGAETTALHLTKNDLIELKQAGATEAFLQYLIGLGQGAPGTTWIRWAGPAWPPRPVQDTPAIYQPAESVTFQEGIPLYPYVFPGYGCSYPSNGGYGHFRSQRRLDNESPYSGGLNLRPFGASLVKAPEDRPQYRRGSRYPNSEPYRRGNNSSVRIRWNGPRRGGGGSATGGTLPTSSTSSGLRLSAPAGSSMRTGMASPGAPRAAGGRAGRGPSGRSTPSGSRRLIRKH